MRLPVSVALEPLFFIPRKSVVGGFLCLLHEVTCRILHLLEAALYFGVVPDVFPPLLQLGLPNIAQLIHCLLLSYF